MKEAPRHIEKAGVLGAAITALCCLGIPAVVSVFAALGLSFLINDAVLVPLMIVSLLLVGWGLRDGWARHGNVSSILIAVVSGALLVWASVVRPSAALTYAAIGGLLAATLLNALLLRRR